MLIIETDNFIKISQTNPVTDYDNAEKELIAAWTKSQGRSTPPAKSTMTSLAPGGIMLTRWQCLKDKAIEKGRLDLIESLTKFLKTFKEKGDELVKDGKKYPYGRDNPYRDIGTYKEDPMLHQFIQSIALTPEADAAGEVK